MINLKTDAVITNELFDAFCEDSNFNQLSDLEQIDQLIRDVQDAAHSIENRKEKNALFTKFMDEILKEFVKYPIVKYMLGTCTYNIHGVDLTKPYSGLGKSDHYVTRIGEMDKVYYSKLNGEKFFIFSSDFYTVMKNQYSTYNLIFFEKVIAENLENAFIKNCCKKKSGNVQIQKQKIASFVGKKSQYLKYDIDELGCLAKINIYGNSGKFLDDFGIWISENFMRQLGLF